jgi:hypothetical protein
MWILAAAGALFGLLCSVFLYLLPMAAGGLVWLIDAGLARVVRKRLAAEDALLSRWA